MIRDDKNAAIKASKQTAEEESSARIQWTKESLPKPSNRGMEEEVIDAFSPDVIEASTKAEAKRKLAVRRQKVNLATCVLKSMHTWMTREEQLRISFSETGGR